MGLKINRQGNSVFYFACSHAILTSTLGIAFFASVTYQREKINPENEIAAILICFVRLLILQLNERVCDFFALAELGCTLDLWFPAIAFTTSLKIYLLLCNIFFIFIMVSMTTVVGPKRIPTLSPGLLFILILKSEKRDLWMKLRRILLGRTKYKYVLCWRNILGIVSNCVFDLTVYKNLWSNQETRDGRTWKNLLASSSLRTLIYILYIFPGQYYRNDSCSNRQFDLTF